MVWMMVWTAVYAAVYFFFIDKVYAFLQLGTCLTIPLLSRYNGRRGDMEGDGKGVLCLLSRPSGPLRRPPYCAPGNRRIHRHRELLTAGGGYCFSSPSRRL